MLEHDEAKFVAGFGCLAVIVNLVFIGLVIAGLAVAVKWVIG